MILRRDRGLRGSMYEGWLLNGSAGNHGILLLIMKTPHAQLLIQNNERKVLSLV